MHISFASKAEFTDIPSTSAITIPSDTAFTIDCRISSGNRFALSATSILPSARPNTDSETTLLPVLMAVSISIEPNSCSRVMFCGISITPMSDNLDIDLAATLFPVPDGPRINRECTSGEQRSTDNASLASSMPSIAVIGRQTLTGLPMCPSSNSPDPRCPMWNPGTDSSSYDEEGPISILRPHPLV